MPDRGPSELRAAAATWVLLPMLSTALMWAWAVTLWPRLPHQIPMHFNAQGHPDRFESTTAARWFLLPIAATMLSALMLGTARLLGFLARSFPQWLNMPHRERFMKLAPREREYIIWPLARMMLGLPVVFAALFGGIQWATERVANGALRGLPLLIPVGGIVATLFWVTFGIGAMLKRARAASD